MGKQEPQEPQILSSDNGGAGATAAAGEAHGSRLPRVDWKRTLYASAGLTVVLAGFGVAIGEDPPAALGWGWFVASIVGLVGLGFWLTRTSRTSGFLGSVVLGTLVGIGVAISLYLRYGDQEPQDGKLADNLLASLRASSDGACQSRGSGWL